MAQRFDNETLKVLTNGGWFPGRNVGKQNVELELKKEGFLVFDEVLNFLSEFEGLSFKFFNKRNKMMDDFNFNLHRVLEIEFPEKIIERYMPRTGEKLSVIGTCYREYFILFLSDSGKMYGAYDDYLVLMGNDGYEAINNIVSDHDFIEIPQG
jgi:hypothetical protein